MAAEIRFILLEISPTEALCPGSWKETIAFLIFLATSIHTPKATSGSPRVLWVRPRRKGPNIVLSLWEGLPWWLGW